MLLKQTWFNLLTVFLLFCSLDARSADPCSQNSFEKATRALSQIAATEEKNLEQTLYRYACQDKYDLYKRPVASLVLPDLNIEDKYGQTSFKFMQPLAEAITDSAFENWSAWESLEKCLTLLREEPDCQQTVKELRQVLIPYIREARQHLALAMDPSLLSRSEALQLNSQLKDLDSYKETPWMPLNAKEKANAQSILQSYIQESRKSTSTSLPLKKQAETVERKVNSVRAQHMIKYQALLSQSSLLQHLSSPNPSDKELLTAVLKLKESSMNELKQLEKAKESLQKTGKVTSQSLIFLKYKSFVEGQLLSDPHSCGLATYLRDASTNRDIGGMLVVGLPLLAASLIAPPLIPGTAGVMTSLGLTAVGGAAVIIPLQNDLDEAKRRQFSRYTNSTGQDMQDTKDKVEKLDEGFHLETNVARLERKLKSAPPGTQQDALVEELNNERTRLNEFQKFKSTLTEDNEELSKLTRNRNIGVALAVMGPAAKLRPSAKHTQPLLRKLSQMKSLLKQVSP